MRFARLTTTLKAFDKPAIKRLDDYLHSPYFKIPATATALFTYLQTLPQPYTNQNLAAEYITGYSPLLDTENKQAIASTQLLKAIEGFITVENLGQQKFKPAWHLLDGLKNLHLPDAFEKQYQQALHETNQCPEQDIDTFYYRHLYTELSFNGFNAKLNARPQPDISPVLQTLDEFYALKKLRYLCALENRKNILGIAYKPEPTAHLIEILKPYTNPAYPYVLITVNMYGLLMAKSYVESLPFYGPLKQLAAAQKGKTLPDSIWENAASCIYWSQQWSNLGYEEAAREYLWWMELLMKFNRLLQKDKISPIQYRNIIIMAVRCKYPADRIHRFIEDYSKYLPESHQQIAVPFAKGLYYYVLKDYKQAGRFLQQAETPTVIEDAVIRRWKFINDYEDKPADTELLYRQLEAFEKFMERNEEGFRQYKTPFALFISNCRQLLGAAGKKEREALQHSIEQQVYFPGKSWLMEQLGK